MKPKIYSEKYLLSISLLQKQTLEELKRRKVKVPNFIRLAINEKIDRDKIDLFDNNKHELCPFRGGLIKK